MPLVEMRASGVLLLVLAIVGLANAGVDIDINVHLTKLTGSDGGITTTFFVKHQSSLADELAARATEVADPASPHYGSFLSQAEVSRLQTPAPQDVAAVEEYIANVGGSIVSTSPAKDKIVASLPASYILQATGNLEKTYSVPQELRFSVDLVSGPLSLQRVASKATSKDIRNDSSRVSPSMLRKEYGDDPMSCLAYRVTPPCLRKAYGLEGHEAKTKGHHQMVIVDNSFKPSDLEVFQKKYDLVKMPVEKLIGKLDGSAGTESTLDIQYIMSAGQSVPTWWFWINGHSTSNPFTEWLTWSSQASDDDLPKVHSLSVGENEADFSRDCGGDDGLERMNKEFQALGARGATIIFASGDSGYQANQKFPASSPFCTSVGGVWNGDLGDSPLQVDDMTTGGFSSMKVNPIQDWQKGAVAHYLSTKGTRPSKMDTDHRCVPDLSIYDAGFYIIQSGSDQPIGGTSAAAPVLGGMVSLLNDALIAKGLSSLGFMNPFLYTNKEATAALLDITRGGNNGYDAVEGYDPASGLGTFGPETFGKLLEAVTKAKESAIAKRMNLVPSHPSNQ